MLKFKIKLCAVNPELYEAWYEMFKGIKTVEVVLGSILEQSGDTLVSPANSFGFMDGGLDQVYTDYFGESLQDAVQDKIKSYYFGELPVGQAFVQTIPNAKKTFKRMIIAPTMRVPEHISGTLNPYHAFRAILIAAIKYNTLTQPIDQIKTLICPGLGTGIGDMDAQTCASQMLIAYKQITGETPFPGSIFAAFDSHEKMHKL